MNAFLYNGLIEHHRHKPKDHQFSYPLYVYGFDLGDLPELDRTLPLFGYSICATTCCPGRLGGKEKGSGST